MGKRKFKKPDESESEYEWQEAEPKIPTVRDSKIIKVNDDLDGLLNKFSSKSRSEMRIEKNQEKMDEQNRIFEERVYKSDKVLNNKFDTQWLKKSFYRCKEQSFKEGIDIMVLLKDRYDDETIHFMMKTFGSRSDKTGGKNKREKDNYYESYVGNDHNKYDSEMINSTKTPSNQRENKFDQIVEERYVTDIDINEASASLLKAEMSGNQSKIDKLQKKINILRDAQKRNLKIRLTRLKREEESPREMMIQKPIRSGKMIPYLESSSKFVSQSRPFDRTNSTINDLLLQEQNIDEEENDLAFAKMSGKLRTGFQINDDIADSEYNDQFITRRKINAEKMVKKEKERVISSQKHHASQLANCKMCYTKLPKHLLLSKGTYFCMIIPSDCGITPFQCQLVPLDHISAMTQISDSDAWEELCQFKKTIVKFFDRELNSETVFMETVTMLKSYPHSLIECIPLSRSREFSTVSNAVFFKKSIEESKSEWCQNRKLLDLKGDGDIRRTVPKGFSYFSVEFNVGEGGYACVIENEKKWSNSFGMEIVGSMMGKDLIEITHRKEKSFNHQADTVLAFERKWKKYDLWHRSDIDDDSD